MLGPLLLAGCFVGDAADGLPCEKDADCGIGVACQEDPATATLCCGGACLVGGANTGSTTTTDGTTDTSSSESSGSSSGASSSSTGALCGNGEIDPGEECDPGQASPCTEDCQLCGNGVLEDGELCDPGIDGEDACEEHCTKLTLLSWDSQSSQAQVEADFEFPAWAGPSTPLAWRRSNTAGAPLTSGPYVGPGLDPAIGLDPDNGWPESRLLSRPLTFPALEATDEVEVQINHAYVFASTRSLYYDHGRVDFVPSPQATQDTWLPLLPAAADATEVTCTSPSPDSSCFALMAPAQPFCDGGGTQWIAGSAKPATAIVPVGAAEVSGKTLQLSFRLRYDCLNPTVSGEPGMNDAWSVAAVSVVARRP